MKEGMGGMGQGEFEHPCRNDFRPTDWIMHSGNLTVPSTLTAKDGQDAPKR